MKVNIDIDIVRSDVRMDEIDGAKRARRDETRREERRGEDRPWRARFGSRFGRRVSDGDRLNSTIEWCDDIVQGRRRGDEDNTDEAEIRGGERSKEERD